MIDESTEFGARVADHLRRDLVVWMTTITRAGGPLPSPVWFLWDGAESVLMFSMESARVRNLEANPRVSLNFDGNAGEDIVVFSGGAEIDRDAPPADRVEPYVEKYAESIARLGLTPEQFAERYSVPIASDSPACAGTS